MRFVLPLAALPLAAACVADPGPQPLDPATAEAACIQAVEARTGTTGASVFRTDVADPNIVVFVSVPGRSSPFSCSADESGQVFGVIDTAITL
ncbi:hypothetical protein DXV76_01120 [Rhodobacteraceae bacterium CCMM004]|nr:hypothetical protein DXV76_08070 [Rhodobacteraceae bacterium CCMM004]RVT86719.1 hypothetical protein DXV76_01120 [Rhodobacteraceae bacterium CCMM004]